MRQNSNRQSSKFKSNNEISEEISGFNKKKIYLLNKDDFNKLNIELTPKQMDLYKTIRNNIFTIVRGPAGTAKTFIACYTALGLLADRKVERIIITKPIVEAGESIGFLPGSVSEKVEVYMKSYVSAFEKILGKFLSDALFASGVIKIELLAYMRGSTYENSIMILDECQNVKMSQLMLWITRLGRNSFAVMAGDVSQYDISKKDAKFLKFIDFTKDMIGVADFEFSKEDNVRNKFLIELTDRYEKWKYSAGEEGHS